MSNQTHAVWWASAGCLPDSEFPAFVGTLEECHDYVENDPEGFFDTVGEHNLYSFTIEPVLDNPEEDSPWDI